MNERNRKNREGKSFGTVENARSDAEVRSAQAGTTGQSASEAREAGKDETVEDIVGRLSADPERGLDEDEAERCLQEHGPNAIEEEKQNPILRFLSYFWGQILSLLEAAIVLAAIAQRWEDLGVIAAMLGINGGVGYWHESKAQGAIEALKGRLAPRARVIRGGERGAIEARELVPGDLVLLRMGDVVPADTRLLRNQRLSIDESALTGESLPVDKDEGELCYSGTTIKRRDRPWPSLPLFLALEGTQIAGTLVAIFGILVHPVHWQYALAVWGYALVSLLVLSAIKVATFRLVGSEWSRG